MDFEYPPHLDDFRAEIRSWLEQHFVGEFLQLGNTDELSSHDWALRTAWERELGTGGWIGLEWPKQYGGRDVSAMESLVFAEEYVRAGAPSRAGIFGEGLLGPTLVHFGTDAQKDRFLGPILRGEEFWCQGFSEPGAGSDLAGLSTKARLDGDCWVIDGQKVWTSQAHHSDWIFLLARTDNTVARHKGISFLLVPLDQPGIDIRPLKDMAGGDHFCEVFFDGATTAADMIVGDPGDGWKMAMATLGFERGTSFVGPLKKFGTELEDIVNLARERGLTTDPVMRQRLAQARIGLELMRFGLFRTVTSVINNGRPGPEASIVKLQWSRWQRDVTDLATDIYGADGTLDYRLTAGLAHDLQYNFLFARAQTIYAGSSEVQQNIIGERVLGLPKD